MDKLLIALYRLLKGDAWLKYAPLSVQTWGDRVRMRRRIRTRQKLVIEEELKGKYRQGFLHLANKYGEESLGDYLEFGVYDGTSLITMHRVLEDLGYGHIRLFGFDSFEGLPITASTDDEGHWQPGAFKSDHEFTMQVLNSEKVNLQRIFLTKGFFESTLTKELRDKHKITKASVIMIDCDMYLSAKEALEFCAPLIVDRAMIVFDDWFPLAERNLGEKRAFDEFLRAHPYFDVEEFGTYPLYGKIFLVSRDVKNAGTTSSLASRSLRAQDTAQPMNLLLEEARILDLIDETVMSRRTDGLISFWNRGAEKMYGWTKDEATGQISHSLLRTQFPKALGSIERDLRRHGQWEGKLVHARRDGTRIEVRSRWVLLTEEPSHDETVVEINNRLPEMQNPHSEAPVTPASSKR